MAEQSFFQDPFILVLVGGSGNLGYEKIFPALYHFAQKKMLPEQYAIVATSRRSWSNEDFRQFVFESVNSLENRHHKHPVDQAIIEKFVSNFHFFSGDSTKPSFYQEFKTYLSGLITPRPTRVNSLYYLGIAPELYGAFFKYCKKCGLADESSGWVRVILEKPFGTSLETAREIITMSRKIFKEEQIFLLDHYLGKETVANILNLRFDNAILEPLMRGRYVDHIQVTAAENFGIKKRGVYYDATGALRDVGQNHILQLVATVTMEQPTGSSDQSLVTKRQALLKKVRVNPGEVVFGQYTEGEVAGEKVVSYLEEENVTPDSQTETFFAFKAHVAGPRWHNVPIYVRAGKQMKEWVTEINVVFKPTGLGQAAGLFDILTIRIQPNEGIAFHLVTKKPGYELALEKTALQVCYHHYFDTQEYDNYEKLLYDIFANRHTFFNNAAEVKTSWALIDHILAERPRLTFYPAGSWGPEAAEQLIEQDGRKWVKPDVNFCRI